MSNGTTTTDLDRPEILEERPMELVINEAFIERLEKAAGLYQGRYLPLAFKLTNEHDWVSQGKGRYYLQASGAEKLCNPFGISWGEPKVAALVWLPGSHHPPHPPRSRHPPLYRAF